MLTIGPGASRAIAAAVLLPLGAVSLPLAAFALDRGPGTENWILPAQLGGMTLAGAGLGAALTKVAGASAGHGRGALVGAAFGLTAGVVADAAWLGLIGG
ncbi:MAG: hypothetical protein JWN72_93 [Thermoleophilia bacterium]|nr:hypothetical protein [Thermoleophilia bacterium]